MTTPTMQIFYDPTQINLEVVNGSPPPDLSAELAAANAKIANGLAAAKDAVTASQAALAAAQAAVAALS